MSDFPVWVVGLGSDHGDDRVGWEVVARLRELVPAGVRVDVTADPLTLTGCPAGCELLVVIDACHGAGPPGSFHRFVWPDSQLVSVGSVSSHGVGLVTALELAATLERLPPRVMIMAIEGELSESSSGLSEAVEARVPAVITLILAEVTAGLEESRSGTRTGGSA